MKLSGKIMTAYLAFAAASMIAALVIFAWR